MAGAVAVRVLDGSARTRGPAFLPAELRPEPQGGLYQGLYKRLRGFILDGVWPAGTRLPSSRALAADLKVSRNTAILAVEQLIADGWAESRSRSGVYVAAGPRVVALPNAPAERPALAELPLFALQRPATDLFPAQIWKQLQAQAWAEIEPHRLLTADPAGDPALREAIARLVCAPRGLRCHPDQILVLPSATMAIDLIAAALLRPGEAAAVEEPGRQAVRQLLRARGATLRPIPVGTHGVDVHALIASAARLACLAPTVQFPTCTTIPADERARLLEWARSTSAWIVEDDRDSEAWFDEASPQPAPLAAEDGERTVLVGSFNRLLFPGLCVAYLVAPPALVERFRTAHAMMGGRASLASQLALAAFIGEGHFSRHLRRRRQAYAERRAALVDSLGAHAPVQPNRAGLHLIVPGPSLRAELIAHELGGMALGGQLLLGLGATPDQIRAEAPRLASVFSQSRFSVEEVR